MRTVSLKFSGLGLALVVAALLVFATTAQAQTPAEDQYGSPTDSSAGSPAAASSAAAAGDPTGEGSAGEDQGVTGGVLPSTGGAPIYLGLAGVILVGTSVTLWLRLHAEPR